jgi:hypothetical protein
MPTLRLDDLIHNSGVSFTRIPFAQTNERILPKEKKVEILRASRVSFDKIAGDRRRKPNASQIATVLVKIAARLEIRFPHVAKIVSVNLPDAYGWNKTAFQRRIDNRGFEPQIWRRRRRGARLTT